MEENQQFKIESVDELKQVYGKYGEWFFTLQNEINDFNRDKEYRWVTKVGDTIHLDRANCTYEVIPNPLNPLKPKEQLEIEISDDRVYAKFGDSEIEVTNPSEDLKAFVEFMDVIQADEEYKEDFLTKYPMTTDEAFEEEESEDAIEIHNALKSLCNPKGYDIDNNVLVEFMEENVLHNDEVVNALLEIKKAKDEGKIKCLVQNLSLKSERALEVMGYACYHKELYFKDFTEIYV